MQTLANQLPGRSESFTKQMLRLAFKFAGEPQTEGVIEDIFQEAIDSGLPSASRPE
jgi:hypothetical protein